MLGDIDKYYGQAPNYWKTYVEEVDQEREMWLNSFYKAPLRLPMPAELEYWWEKGISFFLYICHCHSFDIAVPNPLCITH